MLDTPLNLDQILKQMKFVALGEGLKLISDAGAFWNGFVYPPAPRDVSCFTETIHCCVSGLCSYQE